MQRSELAFRVIDAAAANSRRPRELLDAAADLEASHGQDLLRGRSGDEARTARRRDEAHANLCGNQSFTARSC